MVAQIEGERGIAPVASTGDIQVDGIQVNTTGKTAEEARRNGWREATRLAWAKAGGPQLADGQLEGLVSSVVIEREQIGPRRYIATLGVIFDRTRSGQFVAGASAVGTRSQPLLMLPLLYSGGVAQIYEVRTPWQAAWARFHAGASAIDYVRPTGGGGDSLLLTAGQVSRRSRTWWRNILDQFGASDVIVPVARIERQWPGGPVQGTFTARYGPDNRPLSSFTLTAKGPDQVPAMLDEAVRRMDRIYTDALLAGTLRVNPTLNSERLTLDPAVAALLAAANRVTAAQEQAIVADAVPGAAAPTIVAAPSVDAPAAFTVQFASPDVRAVDAALAAVRGITGVKSAATTSLAMGGTSVMRVSYSGGLDDLAAALRARGYTVTLGNGALSIRR
ncbi:heavy-metal-associated domain-containing protein [Novosphingobium piscinae]|uniref:Heavy-metal-associated domain-containing protein n=1 Tax=Novosphingobium piscinae TaxID=1507448 RepID=A0A7X1FXL7_9SPHN|nr:heavy-metal-associated domain-containing protein [Novosphingobium piscinae]